MTGTGAGERAGWVDIGKGLAIVLVTMHHSVMALDARGVLPEGVVHLNNSLVPFRMPLLFLLSGLFAARAIQSPWRVLLHRRVAHFAYLYVLWSGVLFVLYSLVPTDLKDAPQGVGTIVRWVVDPGTGLWFIYGLALFSVVVKVLWRLPLVAQVAPAACLSVASSAGHISPGGWSWASLSTYFVFFLLGVRGGPWIRAAAAGVRPGAVLLLIAAAGGMWVARAGLDLHDVWGYHLLQSHAFTAAAIGVCVLLERSGRDLGLQWLGARTLPVYLLHIIGIVVLTSPAVTGGVEPGPVLGTVLLPVLAAVAIGWALGVHQVLLRLRMAWLFRLPRALAWSPARAGVVIPAVSSNTRSGTGTGTGTGTGAGQARI